MSQLNTILNSTGDPSQGTYTLLTGTSNCNTITIDASANPWYNWGTTSGNWTTIANPVYNANPSFSYPVQTVIFKIDEDSTKDENTLISRFSDIVNDEIHFYPLIDGKKVEPLETVMKYIRLQKKLDIKLTRSGYDIKVKGVTFKSIRNLLSKDSSTVLKVVFEYDELIYDNTLLTIEEKRSMKVKELSKNIKKNDI